MSGGEVVDARDIFAERAKQVEQNNKFMELVREVAIIEVEWLETQVQAHEFLRAIGLDLSEVPFIEMPDDLEALNSNPELQDARQAMKRNIKTDTGELN